MNKHVFFPYPQILIGGLLLFLSTSFIVSNNKPEVHLTAASELVLNDINLHEGLDTTALIEAIGVPDRIAKYAGTERGYLYEDMGLVFMAYNGRVVGLGITLTWDGDEKFSETPFPGNLYIGDMEVKAETTAEELAGIQEVEMVCPAPIMCASKNRDAAVRTMVAFNEEAITQIVFLFPPKG